MIASLHDNNIDGKDDDLRIARVLGSLHVVLICNWLNMQELGNLDIAMSNHGRRMTWLNMLIADSSQAVNEWYHSHLSLRWIIMRSIRIYHVLVNLQHCLTLSDTTFEASNTSCTRSVSVDEVAAIYPTKFASSSLA